MLSPARIPDWEREEGKLRPWRPALCCRPIPGGYRVLLASLTGSGRRGNFIYGAQPRAVAPSSRRMSSPARIPDWEREERKLHPWRPASCCRPIIPANTMTCSFHLKIFKRSTCTLWRRQHYPSDIFFDDPLHDRTSAQCFDGSKPCQCTLGFRSTDAVLCLFYICLSTIACQCATYLSFVRVFGPCANGGQESYYTHVYCSSGSYGGRIPPLIFICL